MEDALITLLLNIVTAVVAAIVTVRLAIRRFYAERWWERKAIAYETLLGAMHGFNQVIKKTVENIKGTSRGPVMTPSSALTLIQQEFEQVSRVLMVNGFFISPRTKNLIYESMRGIHDRLVAASDIEGYIKAFEEISNEQIRFIYLIHDIAEHDLKKGIGVRALAARFKRSFLDWR
jgi:hypothetical protein